MPAARGILPAGRSLKYAFIRRGTLLDSSALNEHIGRCVSIPHRPRSNPSRPFNQHQRSSLSTLALCFSPLARPRAGPGSISTSLVATAPSTSPSTSTTTTPTCCPPVSTHPSLRCMQVRYAPRNTYNPSHRVRKRRHGFLARLRSRTGKKILIRRKLKRRTTLSH